MSERLNRISSLLTSLESRASYIRSKLGVLVPSQIRSLRLKSEMPRQADLAREAKMHQSRISMFETPGSANVTLETLSRLAAAFKVGLKVQFVPFSEMLRWENEYSQDAFDVTRLADDVDFLQPATSSVSKHVRRKRRPRQVFSGVRIPELSVRAAALATTTIARSLQQERVQMTLQFEPSEPSSAQKRVEKVITMPKRRWSVLDDPQFLKTTAASAGAGVSYGNR